MGMGFGMGYYELMDTLFPVLFLLFFLVFLGTFIYMIAGGLSRWHRNERSPVLTVEAQVVTRRTNVGYRGAGEEAGSSYRHRYTDYYVTFQVESGDRMELEVAGEEYGLLVEGDRGKLTFQGKRYLGFQRTVGDGKDSH